METTTGKEVAIPKPRNDGIKTTGGQLARLNPQSFGELEHMAQVLGKSDIVPRELIGKPANILLVLMFGNEIGLSAAQSLQNVMVVNGRPSLWGDAVMGLVLASEHYEDSKDEFDPTTMTATFRAKRKGKDWTVRTFSKQDAMDASLWTKPGPWKQYPKRMLFHRARSWALRDAFADVLKGIRYFEEDRDIINLENSGDKTYEMPKATAEPAAPVEVATVAPEKPKENSPESDSLGLGPIPESKLFVVIVGDYKAGTKKDGKGVRYWVKDQEGDKYWTDDQGTGEILKTAHNKDGQKVRLVCEPGEPSEDDKAGTYPIISAELVS